MLGIVTLSLLYTVTIFAGYRRLTRNFLGVTICSFL